jgi:hypothetical protein
MTRARPTWKAGRMTETSGVPADQPASCTEATGEGTRLRPVKPSKLHA